MGATANRALPYPDPTARVADGAAAMQALADAVDAAGLFGVAGNTGGKRVWLVVGNITTDASGYSTVTHGAPFTPRAVWPVWRGGNLGGGPTGFIGTDSYTSTTFRCRMQNVAAVITTAAAFLLVE